MKFMGSKGRLAKYILPYIMDGRGDRIYVEPFVGGANLLDKVKGTRIASDNNPYLIAMYKAMQEGWFPPQLITEELYKDIQHNKDKYDMALVAYVGFAMSFGGRFFEGYRRDKAGTKGCKVNQEKQSRASYNSFIKQKPFLMDVQFYHADFRDMKDKIPPQSLIYCDPPYKNTKKYLNKFDHTEFWKWTRQMADAGHTVFVSEHEAPKDIRCIWSKEVSRTISSTSTVHHTEKLFLVE